MKIAIADSNQLDSRGLKALCLDLDGVTKVTEHDSMQSLFECEVIPDLILIDFSTSGFSLDDVSRIRKRLPKCRMVAITPLQPANTVLLAIKHGVRGYVKTDCSVREIGDCVIKVHEGHRFFCGDVLRTLKGAGVDLDQMNLDELSCEPLLLTDRETEILHHIATGLTNSEIADKLFLSSHTITTHRKNIMGKIGAKNTAEAVLYAVKEGVVDTDSISFSSN